ncbi:hypothetical protein ACLOJK_003225 [Asimina triloba]
MLECINGPPIKNQGPPLISHPLQPKLCPASASLHPTIQTPPLPRSSGSSWEAHLSQAARNYTWDSIFLTGTKLKITKSDGWMVVSSASVWESLAEAFGLAEVDGVLLSGSHLDSHSEDHDQQQNQLQTTSKLC